LGAHAVMPAARPSSRYGILAWFVPPSLAGEVAREAAAERDAALAAAGGKVPRRRVRLLPPWLAVYFTLALCLLARLPYQDALRSLAGDGAAGLAVPSTTALTAARRRLGERPLELLFRRVAGVLLPSRDPWATVGGLLVAAWDGTTLKVPATPENIAALGRPRHGGGRKAPAAGKNGKDEKAPPGEGHYPQMRVVALIACGTRALLGAAIGPLADGEQKLAAALTGCLQPGMLLLADRGFWSLALWQTCAATGAHLLWRVKSDIRLPVRQQLPDGSWLTVVNGTREAHRRNMRNANRRSRGSRLPQETGPLPGDVTVRVIEFLITLTCDDGTTRTERYRAVTTLLDWRRYPAADLAAAYARRWGIESAYREAKSYLAGGRILRSRTPDLARQEAWALLITYQAIRALICHAAAGTDPGRLSFTAALNAARRTLGSPTAALAAAGSEILASPLPGRAPRTCARALADPTRRYPARNGKPQPLPQAASYALTITPPGTTTRQHHDQQQHATSQSATPP
jgi:Transposase DDE domain/Insertion element 4 transposase N-terminal